MNKAVRYSISAVVAVGFAAGMGMLLHSSREQRSLLACKEMTVTFEDSLEFVSEKDIRDYLGEEYGDFVGKSLDSIALSGIETTLEAKSAIRSSEAWITDDGVLHVSVAQRAPAMRFMNGEKGFYTDERGCIFPLHPAYTAPVPTVEGAIPVSVADGYKGEAPEEEERRWIAGMLELNGFISRSKAWRNAITFMGVEKNGDIVLETTRGPEKVIFGNSSDTEEKFLKLEKYYGSIVPGMGEGTYKTVNLKYKHQIICRKDM